MEGSRNFNDIVAEPLTKETNEDWFEWVKNYLISTDLWEVTISSSERPGENAVEEFAIWRRNNAAALHVIRISCGPHNLPLIRGASEAKVAWDILYRTYNAPPPPPPRPQEELEMGILYKAIYDNNWSAAKAFIDAHPSVLDPELASTTGETPLHVAAKLGHVGMVEELVRLVPPEYLETLDSSCNTPLLIAATHSGVIPIAKCLINKNSNALAIPYAGVKECVPVSMAFYYGINNEMGRYLYSVTPLHVFEPQNGVCGPTFLRHCLWAGDLDIVLDLLQRCKELLFAVNHEEISTIESIAFNLSFSLNISQLPFWKRWIYHYIKIPSTTATKHLCADIQQGESNKGDQGPSLLHWLISRIYNLLGMKEIRKMKQQHAQSAEILNLVCENLIVMNKEKKYMIEKALRAAAMQQNVEFLLRVTKANPELISSVTPYPSMPFFFDAVASRKVEIFNLFRGFRFKHVIAMTIPYDNNTLLHEAARLAPSSYLNLISGAALQMQRELQWFKAVDNMVDHRIRMRTNDEGFDPLNFFKENHKELRKEGEKWMKATSSSCSVVGALIVTIMFAVAFTVPGGNDQTSGYPIFLKQKLFKVFIIADAFSLFSATTSVLTFLGILTSRYAEEDFLYSLPKKLIIGLSTLFLSIATMMIAFSATIMIMWQRNSLRLWTFLPVILFAGVPITLFVLLQFRLLVEIISSTYGQSIFKKKVETWP